ncbi:accessory Sec system translocase SecA2 [Streptococcus oriscaviae]|uniref:Protein translocase subunit SecA n=1 Tax=Streptococcus oriscaviae TaxID=2781599 RepID=A0ABX7YLD6_9STRE|nr:accessory Sec system translocase SecA2 [Streptococcus oriscaviae]QUE54661.1 accessory Sec system translocase SecA2 [Streptococcus oriscaviae]
MGFLKSPFSLDFYRLKKLKKIYRQIDALKDEMAALTDQELSQKTSFFKQRLAKGETVDSLLVEAYAVVREASRRVLGLFPYQVQVLGAIVLHQGNLAEMKTGEGKTLTATMPLYLNALSGKGAMLITTSAYLAQRDAEEMGAIFNLLGMTVGVGVFDSKTDVTVEMKRKVYHSDIIYTTNSALGFDYLFENLAVHRSQKYMRSFHYAIIDEADAVLLDTAQTPLVISGSPRVQSNLYWVADNFILSLKQGEGYYYDRERGEVWLTQKGMDEAERYFRQQGFYSLSNQELVRHVNLALQAHKLFTLGKQYVIEDGEVKLLDQTDGRTLKGTKIQGGVHQAIEQKEGVKVTPEMRAMASITYQNLFLMFPTLAGMTGTGKSAEAEFIQTYNMEVVQIPTNKPVIRKDYPDLIYTSIPEKIRASLDMVKKLHKKGQPILLVTGSVKMSELYSELLLLEGIPHSLLNAYHAAKEAQMIAEAGQLGAVTVATNMAGRGTDIKLGPGVEELGGLAVIGTERMKSDRADLQMRGRSGRQGDPGFSQFFVSLEDDIVIEHGGKWVSDYFRKHRDLIDENNPRPLTQKRFRRALRRAQQASSGAAQQSRGMTLQFDESVKVQRDYIYKERNAIIDGSSQGVDILQFAQDLVDWFLKSKKTLDQHDVERFILDYITYDFQDFPDDIDLDNRDSIGQFMMKLITKEWERKKRFLKKDYLDFERIALLKAIDESWVEEVDYLQQLRVIAGARQTAQRNPVFEYHKEAYRSYQAMKRNIRHLTVQYLLLSQVSYNAEGELQIYFA